MTKEDFAKQAARECCSPLTTAHHGGAEGRPFWNPLSYQFMYVPAFQFQALPGILRYRYTAKDERGVRHIFEADNASALLTPVWADISRIKGHWRPGIFIGYGFNNDLDLIAQSSDNAAHYYKVYGRGQDIKNLFRVQPHVGYDTGKGLSLWAELEYTMANYTNSGKADNARLILSAVYAF